MATTPDELKVENLALKGGGFRGVAYEGSLEALRDLGQLQGLKRVVGSSAGALTAIGVALNCPAQSFHQFLMKLNSDKILDHGVFSAIGDAIKHPTHVLQNLESIGDAFGKSVMGFVKSVRELPDDVKHIGKGLFLKKAALYKGDQALTTIRDFVRVGMQTALQKHPEIAHMFPAHKDFGTITLGELHNLAVKFPDLKFPEEVVLTATNLSSKKTVHFSYKTHPNLEFAVAARASSSIPIVFEPVMINGDYYVDGGLLDNFPAHEFDGPDGKVNLHTLALRVDTAQEMQKLFWQAPSNRPHSPMLGSLINLLTGTKYTQATQDSDRTAYAEDGFRTIQLPDLGVGMASFNIDDKTKNTMIDTAYMTTIAWYYLYREEAISNLNPTNIGRLKECLDHLHERYTQEVAKSPSNKTEFATDYEICSQIYQRIMSPKPQPSVVRSCAEEARLAREDEDSRASLPVYS